MDDDPFAECTCPHIMLGSKKTEQKNWNPDCLAHGTESEWWNSDEQVAKRKEDRERLIEMQRLAREKRREQHG